MFAIVILSINLILYWLLGALEGAGEVDASQSVNLVTKLLQLTAGITLIVQCFKVSRILESHLSHLRRIQDPQSPLRSIQAQTPLSVMAVFFFGIFYLQYVVNRRLVPQQGLAAAQGRGAAASGTGG